MTNTTNAIERIHELMTARRAVIDEASATVDMIDAMLGNYPAEYASRISTLSAKIEELKAEYPFKASYYNTVSYDVGYFKTYEDARTSLDNYSDCLRVVKNIITEEETVFAGKEC